MKLLRHKRHILAAFLFCLILSIGTVCYADEVPATVTVASAKIRAAADPNSQQLGSAKQGGTVSIIGQTTGADGKTWYQVYVDANTKGFIRADLVKVTGDGTITSLPSDNTTSTNETTTTTAPAANTNTQVTAVDAKQGTVKTNNVRIRKGASTNADVVATANRGMVVTVNGEAAGDDGKTWYQVSFSYHSKEITGFIRSDLVTFGEVPADSVQTTITGTTETPETEPTTEETTEPATEEQPEQTQETPAATDDTQNMILMNIEDTPYVLPEFEAIILKWEGQDINAYKNGDFYLFYAQKQNGESGWYIFDSANGVYQRYVYTSAGATIPENNGGVVGTIPLIAAGVIIVILLAVIVFMFMKLREYTTEYDEYDDEEYDEEYDEEEEPEEVEETYEKPVRKPAQQPRRQPVQQQNVRPQPVQQPRQNNRRAEEQENMQQPRRPEGQPVRRPQQGQQSRRPEGEAPVRRQQMANEAGRPVNRQQPQGNPNRRPAQQRPTQQKNQPQGRKAKNFLEAQDDDMEFIDI